MMRVRVSRVSRPRLTSIGLVPGRRFFWLRSTLTTCPVLNSAPKRAACLRMLSMSSGPWMPSGKPGKFSTSVVMASWPPGSWPSMTSGLRLARAA